MPPRQSIDAEHSVIRITLPRLVSLLGLVVGAVWSAGWWCAIKLTNIETQLAEIRRDQWGQMEHERWAAKLERANRSANLIVPGVNDRPGS